MPGHALHLRLASEVLDRWPSRPGGMPFAPDDPACRRAFLFGSNAPDMGYYPGGDPLLTDLSHYVRPAGLARSLVRSSRTDPQRAFAWGWVTHVLGDAWIHPLINRGVGQLLRGDRDRAVTYDEAPIAHIRVEMGVDGFLLVRDGRPGGTAPAPSPRDAILRLLEEAYGATYGIDLDRGRLAASCRSVARSSRWILAAGRIHGSRFLGRPPAPGLAPGALILDGLALWTSAFSRGSPVYALTHVARPPAWLVDAITEAIGSFADRFHRHYTSGLADLPDYDLDTGGILGEERPYPPAVRTARALDAGRASSRRAPRP